jgi:cysteine synthase
MGGQISMSTRLEHEQYRDALAKDLREMTKYRRRKAKLNIEQATNDYGRAFQAHAASQIKAGTRRDLSFERIALYRHLESKIGNTPLVELHNVLPNNNRIFIKNECDNRIGHSHYDRVYISLFKEKERLGLIRPGTAVFETTSGSAGVSFAAIGRKLGYQCHVAIPAGGEKARERAIENEGAQIYLTPAERYVNGFLEFIRRFSNEHPDYVFLNHSMGNILGRGPGINETAIDSMRDVADEISKQLNEFGEIKLNFVLSAFGNGTNTLGIAKRFQLTEPQASICAYEMVLSGVGYVQKYGAEEYKKLIDQAQRFSASDFVRHNMPGTSYPGIDFPAARQAISLVDRVVLVADSDAEREYQNVTANTLPSEVVKTEFGKSDKYGRSTEAGISVAQRLAEQEQGKSFVVIGYDRRDRYDHPIIKDARQATIGILGGQGKFGAALEARLARTATSIKATVDKTHNREIASGSDLVIVTVQPHNVETLLKEISPTLRSDAQIVSFAAGYPLEYISNITGRPAARGMADPWWNVSAVMRGAGFSEANLHRVFDGLTRKQTIQVNTDRELDNFTVAISYAFVVLLRNRFGVMNNSDEHLEFIAPRIGMSRMEMSGFLPQCDPSELIVLAATKGGVSEAIMQTIQDEPDIKPARLFDRIEGISMARPEMQIPALVLAEPLARAKQLARKMPRA